jgi:lauroyl/myristoyl acyltransferase
MRRSESPDRVEVVLHSPSLYRGAFTAVEDREDRPAKRWGGQYIKDRLQPVLYWLLRHAPGPVALFPFHALAAFMNSIYWLQRNPLRRSCEALCGLARSASVELEPKRVYSQYLANVLSAARAYRQLLRNEAEKVFARVDASDIRRVMDGDTLGDGKAFMLFVPHNLAAIVGGVALTRMLPILIVARNSKTIRRTKLALDVYERIGARILMVRGGNPMEISRAMFSALDDGQVLVATVDNVDPGFGVEAKIFGTEVEFAPWAARIAVRRRVPIVPAYFRSTADGVRVVCGEPFTTTDPAAAIQHYVSFFERCILEDPASWAYLIDRKWSRVMRRAATNAPNQEPSR